MPLIHRLAGRAAIAGALGRVPPCRTRPPASRPWNIQELKLLPAASVLLSIRSETNVRLSGRIRYGTRSPDLVEIRLKAVRIRLNSPTRASNALIARRLSMYGGHPSSIAFEQSCCRWLAGKGQSLINGELTRRPAADIEAQQALAWAAKGLMALQAIRFSTGAVGQTPAGSAMFSICSGLPQGRSTRSSARGRKRHDDDFWFLARVEALRQRMALGAR